MKILIPIDFSAASRQAFRYAGYLAENMDAQLELLHVFDIPVMSADAYVFIPPRDEIEKIKKNHLVHLNEFATHDTQFKTKKSRINYHCIYGIATEQILEFSKQEKVDLIIMGIQGKCMRPSFFMGSTFIHIMNHSSTPVIALHASTKFSELKHILFTYDLKEYNNKSALKPILQLANYFNAHIYVLNVREEISEFPMISDRLLESNLDPNPIHSDISFHIIQNKNIIDGIKTFLLEYPVDLICFIPREHSILSRIFKINTTKKAAFQIDLPFMSIHN